MYQHGRGAYNAELYYFQNVTFINTHNCFILL